MGFDAEWGVLGASDIGAKHHRKRIWIVARQRQVLSYSDNRIERWKQQQESNAKTGSDMADTYNWNGGGNAGGSGVRRTAKENGTYVPSSINPNLQEWLMGWPQDWTEIKPLETDKYRKWRQLHGTY
jgi:site-specific DNA-cytosine methylase